MSKLSLDQLKGYAKNAGFTGNEINVAAAIAMAESEGDPEAHNAKPPDDSYGLWQINMLGSMGPSRRKQFGLHSNADLYNPTTNARVAYGIYKGSGFKAWTTYTSGDYKSHLNRDATAAVPATNTAESVGDGFNPINGVSGAINAFGDTLFKTGANISGVVIAIALFVLGVLLLARGQVASLIPAGKAAKIAKGVLSK